LNVASHELTLLDAEIEALSRQKRGLMQKLLTGEWRVQPDATENDNLEKEAQHAQ
jgi:type I restriction enzyme S subunit